MLYIPALATTDQYNGNSAIIESNQPAVTVCTYNNGYQKHILWRLHQRREA